MTQTTDWRIALLEWLQNNPKKMPKNLADLHQEFLRRFPRERISEMTLETYALGHDESKDSFCYWMEWETQELGSVRGGTSAKWGVWWKRKDGEWTFNKGHLYSSPNDALQHIKKGLIALFTAVEQEQFDQLDTIGDEELGKGRNSLRAKPLYLYFPEHFLPITNPTHLTNILRYFGQKPEKGLHARNRQLLAYLRGLPEFDGFDTLQMMRFLYAYTIDKQEVVFQNLATLTQTVEFFARFASTQKYRQSEYDYKSALLQALREALETVSESDPSLVVKKLRDWSSEYKLGITNLTDWRDLDLFERYLTGIPAEEIQQQLQDLLDEDGGLQERIDTFRENVEAAFQKYTEKKKNINLRIISLLLMGANQDTHIIYHSSAIKKACRDWGVADFISGHRNDGEKYVKLQALVPLLQTKLTKALDRPTNMIDVHSLFWFNHTEEYDEFKQLDRPSMALEERPFMRELLRITQRTKNVILYGPPGTGKTYWLREYSRRFTPKRMRFVTFHQSFAYEEFVEGLKPSSVDGQIRYDVMPGIFQQICQEAAADPENEFLLVIDEINRANIAKVFGELITLIEDDKRLNTDNEIQVTLPYSGKSFGVPNNLIILGTMNTADRSIALLDIALRRRFTFVPVMPNPNHLDVDIQGVSLQLLMKSLNERISRMLDKDHQIGHSYFMGIKNLADLRFAWKHRVLPLVEEYFYGDGERLQALLGNKFVSLQSMDGDTNGSSSDRFDFGTSQYTLAELSDEAFITALQTLAGQSSE